MLLHFGVLPCCVPGYRHTLSDRGSILLTSTRRIRLLPSRVVSPLVRSCSCASDNAAFSAADNVVDGSEEREFSAADNVVDGSEEREGHDESDQTPRTPYQSDETPLIAKDLQQAVFEQGFRPKVYWGKKVKPLRVSEPATKRKHPSKPGKTQNVPSRAKWMILQLRSSTAEDVLVALEKCAKAGRSERADWLYVLKFFRSEEDKGLFFQIYDFVLQEESFEATAQDYTNLMLAYIEVEKYETVEQTMRLMEERDIYPDLVVYTVLLSMYGKIGRFDLVKEKFSEMKLWALKPDTIVYCALVEAYCHLGQPREAELFLKEMEIAELPFKIEIFISLIRGYGNLGQPKEAERMFQLLQLKCIYPERRAYSALMDAYTKNDDLECAISVFDNMVSVGIKPTDNSLARLIIACQNKNLLAQATSLLQKLESKSLKPGMATLATFSLWLDKLGLMEEGELLLDEIERRRSLNRILSRR